MYAALCETWQVNYVKIQVKYILLIDTICLAAKQHDSCTVN